MRLGRTQTALILWLMAFGVPFLPGGGLERQAFAQESTPSHVFQLTQDLISEIEILREGMGAMDYPLEAEPVENRLPLHVYSRALEVHTKLAAAQRRLGVVPFEVGEIPVKEVQSNDVASVVQQALAEVRRIKDVLFIADEIDTAPFVGGKTPSHVYQSMGDASYLLDALVGRPVSINDLYANIMLLHSDLELVAASLGVALEIDPPEVPGRKRLVEVAQQTMRGTFKIINLQTRLGLDASGVPQVTLVRVVPANIYEAISIMQAEIVRIKAHLNIRLPRGEPRPVQNMRPRDVFAQALLLIENLDILARAAATRR